MHKVKLLDYQVNYIRRVSEGSFGDVEGYLCEKFNVPCIEMINATDYDKVEDHILEFIRSGN